MEAVAKEKLLNPEVYLNSSILHPLVYIGTYAKSNADSIFIYRLNTANGELIHVESVKGGERPSYLAFDHQRKYLYTVNEQEEDGDGAVTSFSVDPKSGKLTKVNQQPCPGGPCHLTVDNKNKVLLVANYGKGSVSVFPIQDDGQLSPASDTKQHQGSSVNKDRQEGPHCHYIIEDPDHSHVLVIDLGQDKVLSYRLDSDNGKLTASNPSTAYAGEQGAGPRHLVFHPNKPFAYLINELNSTISVLRYDSEKGVFTALQIIHTIPPNFVEENTCAAIQISPNGKFLYGSNRGHDSIVVCEIAEDTGKLALVEFVSTGGISPRDFTIDLTGNILIVGNQKSNSVLTYKIEHQTGMLTQTGYKIEVPQPVCLKVILDFAD